MRVPAGKAILEWSRHSKAWEGVVPSKEDAFYWRADLL